MKDGSLKITGYISPTSPKDSYPTHLDIYGKGGYRSVATLEDRDLISEDRRSVGMMCYVASEGKTFQLVGSIDNDSWKEFEALPALGTFEVLGISYPEIFVGTSSGKPEASQSFGYALIDIAALNARFLTGNFLMGDAPIQSTYPGAQFLKNLNDGILAKTDKALRSAEPGVDFVDIEAELCYESAIPVWLANANKTLTTSRLKIIDGNDDDGDDLQGVRNFIAKGGIIARSAITSDDSVFGLQNVGAREVKIYDRIDQGAGRLTRSVNFISAYNLAGNVNFYLPETESTEGQVLADIGQTIEDGRVFRKLSFVDIASNAAKYILQEPNESLPNSQALSVLGTGLIKTTNNGVLALAVKDVDYASQELLEQIKAETEVFKTEAQTAATEASVSATEASVSAIAASTSAATATAEATAAGISAAASAASAVSASVSSTNASSYADEAQQSSINAAGSADLAFTSATNASNSANIAGEKAVLADASATESEASANESEANATLTEQLKIQVQQLISQYMQGGMSTSIIDISWASGDDPNEPRVFNNNFQKITTLTTPPLSFIPKAAYRFGVIDSSLTPANPNVKSIYWQNFYNFGDEELVNANYGIDFYHKILNTVIRPFEIGVTSDGAQINLNAVLNLTGKNITGLADPAEDQDAATKKFVIDSLNNLNINISLQGAVVGNLVNGVIDTTLTPINTSQINEFDLKVTNIAKSIALNSFAVPTGDVSLNNQSIINCKTPLEENLNYVANVQFVKGYLASGLDITLTGAVQGVYNNQIIETNLGAVQAVNLPYMHFNFQDTGVYNGYSFVNYLPDLDPAPYFDFVVRSGSIANNTFRSLTLKMDAGSESSIENEFQLVLDHSLLANPVTPVKISYSNPDQKCNVDFDAYVNLGVNRISSSATPVLSGDLTNKTYVDTKPLNSFPVTGIVDAGSNAVRSSYKAVLNSDLVNKEFLDDTLASAGLNIKTSLHKVYFGVVPNSSVSYDVVFSQTYTTEPTVTTGLQDSSRGDNINLVLIQNLTTTGCRVYIRSGGIQVNAFGYVNLIVQGI